MTLPRLGKSPTDQTTPGLPTAAPSISPDSAYATAPRTGYDRNQRGRTDRRSSQRPGIVDRKDYGLALPRLAAVFPCSPGAFGPFLPVGIIPLRTPRGRNSALGLGVEIGRARAYRLPAPVVVWHRVVGLCHGPSVVQTRGHGNRSAVAVPRLILPTATRDSSGPSRTSSAGVSSRFSRGRYGKCRFQPCVRCRADTASRLRTCIVSSPIDTA